ncbi:ABC transporter ATP-binding protein [Pseudohalioglobus sediminis]|uniref:ABC transporter ATP-binding protein n=1 Tax=Pseudohalioglobus sediminis TaxID=2606449 RepID=UPI00165F0F9E|nr:ABC transporter ATP-binding protein [Pseudohalioglobus sediminis]
MNEPAILTRGLSKRFGELVAVDNIDLDIQAREIYGFLGPNGSGKTTAIRMLCGLLTPSAGSVRVLELDIPGDAERLRRRIGYMTQAFSLYDDLSVEENLGFLARIHGLPRYQGGRRIEELLDRYTLRGMRARRAADMSGGQRQRLALAAATLHSPDLLFLDEPTSAVDPENRRDFWEKLFDLVDEGKTILVSTHYMDEAERCHQLAILDTGRLRRQGSPAQLMAELDRRVVEVRGHNLRQVKSRALQIPEVESAAQQGMQLRVLMNAQSAGSAIDILRNSLADADLEMVLARPSLEDVFVASTQDAAP